MVAVAVAVCKKGFKFPTEAQLVDSLSRMPKTLNGTPYISGPLILEKPSRNMDNSGRTMAPALGLELRV